MHLINFDECACLSSFSQKVGIIPILYLINKKINFISNVFFIMGTNQNIFNA